MKIPDHLVFVSDPKKDPHRNRMRCEHCGASDPLPHPIALRQFELITKDFIKRHRRCPPSSNQKSKIQNQQSSIPSPG